MEKYVDVSFDGKTPLDELFDKKALDQANQFPDKKINKNGRWVENKNALSKSQIRRFFGEVKSLHMKYRQIKNWEKIKPMFKMLRSKAAYASSRGNIPIEFKEFLDKNIDKVNEASEFENFVMYFEAVLAYAYENKVGNN
jgi:CRISPR type III-A-associated protein Csm2